MSDLPKVPGTNKNFQLRLKELQDSGDLREEGLQNLMHFVRRKRKHRIIIALTFMALGLFLQFGEPSVLLGKDASRWHWHLIGYFCYGVASFWLLPAIFGSVFPERILRISIGQIIVDAEVDCRIPWAITTRWKYPKYKNHGSRLLILPDEALNGGVFLGADVKVIGYYLRSQEVTPAWVAYIPKLHDDYILSKGRYQTLTSKQE